MPPKKKRKKPAEVSVGDVDASPADMPTAQSAPSAVSSAVRDAAKKRKRVEEMLGDDRTNTEKDQKMGRDADGDDDTNQTTPPKSCVHQVAIPPGWVGDEAALRSPTYKGRRAKEYEFQLDPFQETSVAVLERDESVMVAAHTSAGKTVVAEYAIAMAFRDKQRVIYTSPLKALSNQKFRELTEEFGGDDGSEVGLMTGDVSINQNATCVVMTTEVLRSMLYRGSDIIREVKWIIFDEVHYMRDRERGVIWEETIIFCPKNARMVFLSATLPNAFQFAKWITKLHAHPCHVVYTDHRPTPLLHYAFPRGGKKPLLVVDAERNINEGNFQMLTQELGVYIGLISHLKKAPQGRSFEEGYVPSSDDLRGSGSIKQLSNNVYAISRNQQEEDDRARNTSLLTVLKFRYTGRTGKADYLYFDEHTGRMVIGQDPDVAMVANGSN